MATTIKLKNGSGAPLAGDLVQGEPALDLTNKRLYTEDSGGTVIEVGTNPGTDVTFADNRKAVFGVGSDLQIYHDGTNSWVKESNATGSFFVDAANLYLRADDGQAYLAAVKDSYVRLYHDDSVKLETTSTGIDVTGDVNSDSVTTGTFTSTGIDDNATSTAITIDASENVGIGTASPSNELEVAANSSHRIAITATDTTMSNGADYGGIRWVTNDASNPNLTTWEIFQEANGTTGASELVYDYQGSEKLRIDGSGNVGIGTTPSQQGSTKTLHIQDGSGATLKLEDGTDEFDIQNVGGTGFLVNRTANPIAFYTNSTERMRIDGVGNVGIGTSSPGHKLEVNASAFDGIQLQSAGTDCGYLGVNTGVVYVGAGSTLAFHTGNSSLTNGSERMRIDSSGALLIGRTSGNPNSSSFGINFDGGGRMLAASNYGATGTAHQFYGNAGSVRILGDGDLENTNNSYTGLSDARLKSNIVDASSQIDDIMAVQVRSYTLNETGATHIGVVAQELEASGMSGLVKTKDDGMKSVKYSILYVKAIKALQEAVTRIETLEAEVAALKGA